MDKWFVLQCPFFLILALGAIAPTSVLNACSSSAQNQSQTPDAIATDAGTKQIDHGNMGGMNHGNMQKGGMMDHMMDLGPVDVEFDLRFIDRRNTPEIVEQNPQYLKVYSYIER